MWKEENWPLGWYLVCFRKPENPWKKSDRKNDQKKNHKNPDTQNSPGTNHLSKKPAGPVHFCLYSPKILKNNLEKASNWIKNMPQRKKNAPKNQTKIALFFTLEIWRVIWYSQNSIEKPISLWPQSKLDLTMTYFSTDLNMNQSNSVDSQGKRFLTPIVRLHGRTLFDLQTFWSFLIQYGVTLFTSDSKPSQSSSS